MNEQDETLLVEMAKEIDTKLAMYIFEKIKEVPHHLRDEENAAYFYLILTAKIFKTTQKYLEIILEMPTEVAQKNLMELCLSEDEQ